MLALQIDSAQSRGDSGQQDGQHRGPEKDPAEVIGIGERSCGRAGDGTSHEDGTSKEGNRDGSCRRVYLSRPKLHGRMEEADPGPERRRFHDDITVTVSGGTSTFGMVALMIAYFEPAWLFIL